MDHTTSESEVAALVDYVKRHPQHRGRLVELLPERHPLYRGRSSNAVVRLRGYVMAAFEQVGLPATVRRYVLDELQNGRHAYLVAAAAMAIRGLEEPTADVVPFLLSAIQNMKYSDDKVTFDTFPATWPAPSTTTALAEIIESLAWIGDHAQSARPALEALAADPYALSAETRMMLESLLAALHEPHACCHEPHRVSAADIQAPVHRVGEAIPSGIQMQDQDGRALLSQEFFGVVPTVVTFFYTRCDNPNKCSLTVTKLAEVQRRLRQDGVSTHVCTAAISYDSEYDLPLRLRAYGQNRGVQFSDEHRFLRVVRGFARLSEFFELGVNYGPGLVNRHRIELFVLDHRGRIAKAFTRLQWDIDDVLAHARR